MSNRKNDNPRQTRRWKWTDFVLLVVFLPIMLALTIIVFSAYILYSTALHLLIWLCWCTRGRDVLFVYSDSPISHDYLEEKVLPHIRERAVVLNWSQRKQWRPSLAKAAFEHFGGSKGHNPMGVVFRPLRLSKVFEFSKPFRDFKHGKPAELNRIEAEFFAAVGVNARIPLPD